MQLEMQFSPSSSLDRALLSTLAFNDLSDMNSVPTIKPLEMSE